MVYEKDAGEGMKKSLRREKEMLWSIVVVVNREKGKVSRRKASLTSMALSFFFVSVPSYFVKGQRETLPRYANPSKSNFQRRAPVQSTKQAAGGSGVCMLLPFSRDAEMSLYFSCNLVLFIYLFS